MIIVTGEVRFGEGEIERLKPALEKAVAATRAEPGCGRYSYAVDLTDPNLLHIAEEWSDEEAIDGHMQSLHMAELMGVLGGAKIEAIGVNAYHSHFLKTLLGAEPEAGD